jgi:zinc-ribbon domain
MAVRYCTNCGQELSPDDRFCANCGAPVHRTARVPTPEADVSPPPQAGPTRPTRTRSEVRGPMLALVGVFLAVGAVETAREMAKTNPGGSFAYQLGYAVGGALPTMIVVAVVALLVGAVVYGTYLFRGGRVTVLQAIFNWPVVVVAALFAFLQYI